jgi:ABC-type polysaccharide/polyol phosphate export permease
VHAVSRRDADRHQRDADADVSHARLLAAIEPSGRAKYILWNPFAQMLDLLRTPLMGNVPDAHNWWGILGWTAVSVVASCALFAKYRRRVVYWL